MHKKFKINRNENQTSNDQSHGLYFHAQWE